MKNFNSIARHHAVEGLALAAPLLFTKTVNKKNQHRCDVLSVDPHDMSVNMGMPQQYDHPDLIATIQKVIDTGTRNNNAAGS